ncbi:DUF4097 family beta strand repeat-containing protein [Bacillus sp. T33-2]|uniref:DUF4097 family beta strand repeat-containing protein n=1 Tax=Bacillus sp. T33-2 TaxID=2054168 RepID=UPI000C77340C|nr:DUF4097 domain-containing protein [Bacillus sp. T33-2]PLR99106.1 DUF4097 domain-containing protein [Bacillus sp. T33-2]
MKEERKRILKMVEDGKLSVDEALTLLEGLEKAGNNMEQPAGGQNIESASTIKFEEVKKEPEASVKFEEVKKEEYGYDKFQAVKDRVFDFVDTALKKVKDLDLDFNFGQSVAIRHIFQQREADINKIDIDLANGAVQVIPWDENEVRIQCDAMVYRVENEDEARSKFLQEAIFSVEGQKLRLAVQQKWMKVETIVSIPREQYDSIKIRLFNGPIQTGHLNVKDFKAKTANGKIKLEGLNTEKLEAETGHGAIDVKGSKAREIELETLHGAIKSEGDFAIADLQSVNGNITCTLHNQDCETIEAKTATGSIELIIPAAASASGNLKSNLGGFTVDLKDITVVEEKNEMVQKMMRFKPLVENQKQIRLYADTKTGSIYVRNSAGVSLEK